LRALFYDNFGLNPRKNSYFERLTSLRALLVMLLENSNMGGNRWKSKDDAAVISRVPE
jgi:hypothetical protein